MANASEYNMLFKLSAQLGREFGTTFGTAKRTLADTQKEINALNQTQADISAYEKQRGAVENVSQKLESYRQQLANVQREISETENFNSSLANKELALKQKIEDAEKSLAKKEETLKEMGTALHDAGIDTDHLTDESAKLTKQMDDLAKKQTEAAKQAQNFGVEGVSSFEAVGNAMVAAGIATGLKAIYDEYKECISIAADFEETMSTVEALSGATAEEMQNLSSYAKQLGATTKFTAKESAEAMTYMGMAGWDAQQMIDGMSGVLNLAAASGEDLAATSDIVTDNLTAFGLKASDTAHFSDVLAAAATNSNTSVAIMGETFKNSAALAGALGYSVEDVAVAIGLMANAGIKGSNAGTALKNVFNGLLSGVTLTAEAFGEVEYSAINADGTMKSFGETMQELREYFDQMTGAEKLQNAETLAGQRAMSGFVSIMNSTDADFQKLTASIANCSGSAQRMADIKLDNLNGQLTLLNSAADAVKTTVGEAYNEELRALAKIGTDILTGINDFLSQHPILLKSLIAITAEIGLIVAAYYGYIAAKKIMNTIRALSTVLEAKEAAAAVADATAKTAEAEATTGAAVAQTALNTAMTASPIGWIIAGVAALTVGVVALVEIIKSETDETKKLTAASQEQYDQLQTLNAEYEEACKVYGETSDEARALHGELILLEEDFESSKMTMAEFNQQVEDSITSYEDFVAQHKESMSAINREEDVILALVARLERLEMQTSKTEAEKEQMLSLVDQLNEKLPALGLSYDKVTDALNSTSEAIRSVVEAEIMRKKYEQNYQDYYEAVERELDLENKLTTAKENTAAAQAKLDALYASDTYKNYQKDIKSVADEVSGRNFASKYQSFCTQLNKAKEETSKLQKEQEKLQKEYDDSVRTENELLEAMGLYSKAVQQSAEDAQEAVENTQEYRDALDAIRKGYLDVETAAAHFGVSKDLLQQAVDTTESYKTNLESAIEAVESGFYSAKEAAKIYGVTIDAIEKGSSIQDMIDKIGEIGEKYAEVRDAAEQSIQGQYDLWDTAAVVIATDIDTINTALETQLSYWSDYNTDLANLLARTDDIDGLSEVIATFADGSDESVNAIAGMAAASDSDLRKMVDNWQEVQKQQKEASDSIAELATGFSEELDNMKSDLEEAVDGLNLDDEATAAAKETVNAYVQAIRDGTDDAVRAASALASQVAAALSSVNAMTPSASASSSWSSYNDAADAGYSNIMTEREWLRRKSSSGYSTYQEYLDAMRKKYLGYASGTDSATPGMHIVGETGPELMMFRGGEQVLTADETKEYMRQFVVLHPMLERMLEYTRASENHPKTEAVYSTGGEQIKITVSPSFVVESSDSDIEDRLRIYSEELKGEIFDALDEAGIDAKRGVYA